MENAPWKEGFVKLLVDFQGGSVSFPDSRFLVAKVEDCLQPPEVWEIPFFEDRNAYTYEVSRTANGNGEFLYITGTDPAIRLFDSLMRKSNALLPATMTPKESIHEFSGPVIFDPIGNWARLVFETVRKSRRPILRKQCPEFDALWLTMNPFEASLFTIKRAVLR